MSPATVLLLTLLQPAQTPLNAHSCTPQEVARRCGAGESCVLPEPQGGYTYFPACAEAAPPPLAEVEPCPAEQSCATHVEVLAGAMAAMGAESGTGVVPFGRIGVSMPLAQRTMAPRLVVSLDLTAAPGQTVSFSDPTTFNAVEARVGISQRLARVLNFSLYAEAGFTTRLRNDPAPRDRAARWGAVGVSSGGDRGALQLGIGVDQRLDGTYLLAATMRGDLQLYDYKGASLRLVGEAVLGIQRGAATRLADGTLYYPRGQPADFVRVGVVVGVGR